MEFSLQETGKLLPRPKEAVADLLPKHLLFGWRSAPVQVLPSSRIRLIIGLGSSWNSAQYAWIQVFQVPTSCIATGMVLAALDIPHVSVIVYLSIYN